jgi:serine protease AprX
MRRGTGFSTLLSLLLFLLLLCGAAQAGDILLRSGRIPEGEPGPGLPADRRAGPSETLYIVQFPGIDCASLRARLKAEGAELLTPLPEHAWIVRLAPSRASSLRRKPYVLRVLPFHPGYRLAPELLDSREVAGAKEDSPARRRVVLQTFAPGPSEKKLLAGEVAAAGGRVVRCTPNGYLLEAELTAAQITKLAHSDHLLWMEPWQPDGDDMDIVREVSGVNFVEGAAGYDGTGVRGEVMDSGIMQSHPDFDGLQIHGPAPDVDAHGTSVYGILFGNGNRDGDGDARATGILPGAVGYFAARDGMTDRYQHTAELVSAPIFAVFQSNAWGTGRSISYTSLSAELDDIVWLYDIAVFQSQSNEGNRYSRPQAWCKNVISVGGVRHRDTATLSDDGWGRSASIGPAEDGRIKPDLVHFYDMIYTTDMEPGGYAAGLYVDSFGGTSASTPIAAGIGGLAIEMWADNRFGTDPQGTTVFEKRPHASTTKALLINSAEPYPFSGEEDDLTRMHQGWGLPDARRLYERAPRMRVVDEKSALTDFDFDSYLATVPAGQDELRVTLVYTDRAGAPMSVVHRVNDLSLRVTAPDGTIYWGNNGLLAGNWSVPGGEPDSRNTVENVFLQNPAPGDWIIEVFADEIRMDAHLETPEDDQDYALVVYGVDSLTDCRGAVPPPAGLTAAPAGDNAISLNWSGTASGYRVLRAAGGCSGRFESLAEPGGGQTTYLDAPVSGGVTFGYVVRAVETCESPDSACAEAVTTGPCSLEPAFGGAVAATGTEGGNCGIRLLWADADAWCGGPVRYNIYRSPDPIFLPSDSNRIAGCLSAVSYLDQEGLAGDRFYYYIVRAVDLGGEPAGPCGGLEERNSRILQAQPGTLLWNDFEDGFQGWSSFAGSPPARMGLFVVGDPVGTWSGGLPAQPEEDHTADGTKCLYTDYNLAGIAGQNDVTDGEVVALSPLIDAAGAGFTTLQLSYWRWHFNHNGAGDSDDGQSWTNLEFLDFSVQANSWTEKTFDLDSVLPLTDRMRLRVRSADGEAWDNIIESAVDDVRLKSRLACTPSSTAPGVITGRPGPLLAVKSGASVQLTWGPDCGAGTQYGVYRGDLDAGFDSLAPVPGSCDLAALTIDLPLAGGNAFYLVAPNDGAAEGSLGLLPGGLHRPQPPAVCYPRSPAVNPCAP